MRFLKKVDGDGTLWPWTEILANRRDMVEVSAKEADEASKAVAAEPAAVVSTANIVTNTQTTPIDTSDADRKKVPADIPVTIDPLDITDKDELKRLLTERGVKYSPNAGVTNLQAKLAEAIEAE